MYLYVIFPDNMKTKVHKELDPIHTSCHFRATAVPNQIQSIVFSSWFGTAVAQQQHDV